MQLCAACTAVCGRATAQRATRQAARPALVASAAPRSRNACAAYAQSCGAALRGAQALRRARQPTPLRAAPAPDVPEERQPATEADFALIETVLSAGEWPAVQARARFVLFQRATAHALTQAPNPRATD
jgi:hypothetical protein